MQQPQNLSFANAIQGQDRSHARMPALHSHSLIKTSVRMASWSELMVQNKNIDALSQGVILPKQHMHS